MNRSYRVAFLLGTYIVTCFSREPFKPPDGNLPFLVYYKSYYRGLCVGTLASRMVVVTAAVCVTDTVSAKPDTRPINVVTAATYRHPKRGIRVQVTKILLPKLSNITSNRGYLMQKSAAILLLKKKVPDVLAEVPLRAINIDYTGEEVLTLQEECLMAGWHFFYKEDKIYPVHKFLLQRNVRLQFLNIVKKHVWCETLTMKFQKAIENLGFIGYYDSSASVCVRDPDRTAQPCHGMYGAPLICRGTAVGMLMAPDAQWTNCTGFSNIVHLFNSNFLRQFFECVSGLFNPEHHMDLIKMKKALYDEVNEDEYDYLPDMYDRLLDISSSTSDEN